MLETAVITKFKLSFPIDMKLRISKICVNLGMYSIVKYGKEMMHMWVDNPFIDLNNTVSRFEVVSS